MQATRKPSIQSLLLDEIAAFLATQNERPYRAKQIVDWIYEKRVGSFAEMSDLPQPLRDRLAGEFAFHNLETVRVLGSADTTRKFLFRLSDGNLIESVLIPALAFTLRLDLGSPHDLRLHAGRLRLRLQVLRERSRRIFAQSRRERNRAATPGGGKASGERIDNVVFMGMGEPLANFDNVVRAIRIINAPWGLEIGARHITVSTSGLAPQIRKLADEPLQSRLAISLHGATDEVRNKIMPVNRKYDLTTLLAACDYYASRKKQRIYFEYILIAGVNDAEEQAHLLAGHARRLGAKVNLIPYNTVEGLEWSRPSREKQERFLSIVRGHGVVATLRREKGHDIDAACGQLRLQTKRNLEAVPATAN